MSAPPEDRSFDSDPDYRVSKLDEQTFARLAVGFRVWSLDRLTRINELPMDVYLPFEDKDAGTVSLVLVARARSSGAFAKLTKLQRLGVIDVFIPEDQVPLGYERLRRQLGRQLRDPYLGHGMKADTIYDNALQIVDHALSDARLEEKVRIGREFIEDVAEYVSTHIDVARHLGDILSRDQSLYTHSVNVCLLSLALARYLDLSPDQIVAFGLGGLFHDVGKKDIPEAILTKKGSLTEDEWEIMRQHPTAGFEMLRTAGQMPIESLRMVYQHHENLDGTGYPRGLREEDIPDQCRLIRILDAYDALTSTRSFRKAAAPWEAVQIIYREMDGQVCARLLKVVVTFLGWMNPDNIKPLPLGWIAG